MAPEDEPDDASGFGQPLPPEDRLWRHPSELGPAGSAQPITFVSRSHPSPRVWTVSILSALVGAAATIAVLAGVGVFEERKPDTVVEQIQRELPKQPNASDLAIAEQVIPAVARIDVTGSGAATGGSAVVFRTDGHLLTTADAVDGADAIAVTFNDGRSAFAQLVGVDRATDLAVLKVDRNDLPSAVLGQVGGLKLGEPAIAVACTPSRPGAPTVSVGLVSATGQRVTVGDSSLYGMIQTNVHLDDNSSGSVLIDSSGSVIGIITARGPRAHKVAAPSSDSSDSSSTTDVPTRFATPIDYAKSVADELIATGRVSRPWLGVEGTDLEPKERSRLGRGGAKITLVTDGGPAQSAGVKVGDVIVSIDGQPVDSMAALVVALRTHHPSDVVALGFVSGGEPQVGLATLVDRGATP